ncbi:hypothetical protein M0R45_008592 [Rubus argutus]|uniref:Uncharacterized protein n=1 Tax=Rubus argutus TaxID=59490 RepID=A0AAW1Y1N7_RUBAR
MLSSIPWPLLSASFRHRPHLSAPQTTPSIPTVIALGISLCSDHDVSTVAVTALTITASPPSFPGPVLLPASHHLLRRCHQPRLSLRRRPLHHSCCTPQPPHRRATTCAVCSIYTEPVLVRAQPHHAQCPDGLKSTQV